MYSLISKSISLKELFQNGGFERERNEGTWVILGPAAGRSAKLAGADKAWMLRIQEFKMADRITQLQDALNQVEFSLVSLIINQLFYV